MSADFARLFALKQAIDLEKLKNPQHALQMAEQAITLAHQLNTPSAHALAWWVKGEALRYLSRYQEARHCYQQAATLYTQLNQLPELVSVQVPMIYVLGMLGDLPLALELAHQTRTYCQQLGEVARHNLAYLDTNLGTLYYQQGDFAQALAYYGQSRTLLSQLGELGAVARLDINQANILMEMDRFAEAATLFQQARQILKEDLHYHSQIPVVELNLGILAYRRGEYQEALRFIETACIGFTNMPNHLALAHLRRAYIYHALHLAEETVRLGQEAEQLLAASGMKRELAHACHIQGLGYWQAGQYAAAESVLQRAQQLFQAQGASLRVHKIEMELAKLAFKQQNFAIAQTIAYALAQQLDPQLLPYWAGQVALLLAELAWRSLPAQLPIAQKQLAYALSLAQQHQLPELLIEAYHLQGQLLAAAGDRQGAWAAYERAIAEVEEIRQQLQWDEFRAYFMDEKLPIYEGAIQLWLSERSLVEQQGQLCALLNQAQLAPLLLPALSLSILQPALFEELRQLRQEWHWYQSKLENITYEKQPALAQIQQKIRHLETNMADTTRRLAIHHPVSSRHSAPHPLLLPAIQERLADDEALLHYFVVQNQFYGMVIEKEQVQTVPLAASEQVARLLQGWRHHLRDHDLITQSPELGRKVGHRFLAALYQQLFAPLESLLTIKQRLFVVLPASCHDLPLAAFRRPDGYLLHHWQLVYLSAPEALLSQDSDLPNAENSPQALVMGLSEGGALPHSLLEAEQVANSLPIFWQKRLYLESEATWEHFQESAGTSQLIHLSTHATFRPDNPLFSWLRLADQRLTMSDLYQKPLLGHPLVVLSACETGRGQARGGGLLGMARALLTAGANGLVVTLWRVEDRSTAQLMHQFYTYALHHPQPFAPNHLTNALRRAQLALISDHHPFFWAGFIYIAG